MSMNRNHGLRRVLTLVLALLTALSTVTAVGYTTILSVFAAEESVDKYAPAGTELVSVGATVTLSSCTNQRAGEQNSYEMTAEKWSKALLVDGKIGNGGWSSQPYDREMDTTKVIDVTLELVTESDISAVTLFPLGIFPAKYEIQTSVDGISYTKVAEDGGLPYDQKSPKTYTFASQKAKFVRLHIIERNPALGPDGALAQLAEMAVYGVANVSVSLDRSSIELFVGETDKVNVSFLGTKKMYPLTYKSSDTSVLSVASDGTLTAKKLGKADVTVTCAQLNTTATLAVKVVETKHSFDENILLSIFWPPTPQYITDEQYKLIADAGINWVMGAGEETLANVENQKRMLELCAKYGIGMTVSDGNFGGSLQRKTAEQIAAAVARYKNVPAAYGFYILDEPLNPNGYLDAYINLKKAAPEAYMHLNFLPSGSYGSDAIYRAQMNDWARLTATAGYPLDYLIFDRYPFPLGQGTMDRKGFFQNVRACHDVGLKNDVKTGLYIQTVCQEVGFRRPTDSEIRYEMYASLAFGYKQLSFFTWFTPVNRNEPFRDGIIAPDGTPNAHYETVKTINHEILAIGETLVKCDALEVYFNGPDTYGQPSVPDDFFVQAEKKDTLILSFLRHKETGRNYLMVVNNDFSAKQDIQLTFDKAITSLSEVSRVDGTLKPLTMNGQVLKLTLAAGDAMLMALPEGFDHYVAPEGQPEASVNLAIDAMITAPWSLGEEGWYIACLQDGERITADRSKGWRSENSKDTYVDIDLGRVLKFNRVDFYPAGTVLDYGGAFPTTIKISVSNDGKNFTEVKTLEGLSITKTTGIKTDLETQEARYIRIDLQDAPKGARFMALNEIEVYNDDGTVPPPPIFTLADDDGVVITYTEGENIAKGKKVFYSSTTPPHFQAWGWDFSYINDGKSGNGWTSNVGLNRTPNATEYIGIDFGDLFAVEKVILEDNGVFPEDFEVALSVDGVRWTVIRDVKGEPDKASGEKYEILLETPVNARFVQVTGTKLRGGGNDGYLLQLGEIEAYGRPVCDKTVLEQAIAVYQAEGGKTGQLFNSAVKALENPLLTQTQAKDLAKRLLALVNKELETTPPETDPVDTPSEETTVEPEVSTPEGDTTVVEEPSLKAETTAADTTPDTKPAKKGCGSAMGLSALILMGAVALVLGKKRKD